MSKKQKILATMLAFVMILTCNMDVFAWQSQSSSYGTHAYLISNAGSCGKLSSFEQSLLLEAVKKADQDPFKHNTGDTVHGAGNYVKNLRFLYTVSYNLNKKSGDGGQWKNVVDATVAEFSNSNIGKPGQNIIDDVNNLMNMSIITGNESTYRLRSIKILGLALHLGEDIYAHQVMLPASSKKEFESIFKSNNISLSENQKNKLNEMNKSSKVRFKDIITYESVFSTKLFEDNAKFFPERYTNASKYTVNKLLEYYTSNKEWGLSILLPWVQTSGCTITYTKDNGQRVTTNLKISNLSSNITKSGYSENYVQDKFGINPNDYTVFK